MQFSQTIFSLDFNKIARILQSIVSYLSKNISDRKLPQVWDILTCGILLF